VQLQGLPQVQLKDHHRQRLEKRIFTMLREFESKTMDKHAERIGAPLSNKQRSPSNKATTNKDNGQGNGEDDAKQQQ
jgi:hypothetical protein